MEASRTSLNIETGDREVTAAAVAEENFCSLPSTVQFPHNHCLHGLHIEIALKNVRPEIQVQEPKVKLIGRLGNEHSK